jgi:hypothetical protein
VLSFCFPLRVRSQAWVALDLRSRCYSPPLKDHWISDAVNSSEYTDGVRLICAQVLVLRNTDPSLCAFLISPVVFFTVSRMNS